MSQYNITRPHPQFKIVTNGETFINDKAVNIRLVRPENSVSDILLTVDDYKSTSFVDVFDSFNTLELHLRYISDSWTKVFSGIIQHVCPSINTEGGELLQVSAQGEGAAIVKTHCNSGYGVESENPAIDTPKEIWDDLVDNYINKSFGGAATGYAITKTKIANITNPSITHILSPYDSNFNIISRICEIYTAYRNGNASVHWFVDPDKNLFVNTIGTHENNASGWPTYWNSGQAASTIEVKKVQLLYQFQKRIAHFANKIILCSLLRKPAYDYWTEGQASLWGDDGDFVSVADEGTIKQVGNYSIKISTSQAKGAFYPSAQNAGWDFTKIGSLNNPPTFNFWARIEAVPTLSVNIQLRTSAGNYFHRKIFDAGSTADKWYLHTPYVGPYYRKGVDWDVTGSPDWSNINYIRVQHVEGACITYWDDMHFAGRIIREAYNSTSISAKDEYQTVILNQVALDDSMKATDDTGTTARLAYAELLRRQTEPTVGIIQIPMAPTMLPGQLIHVHSAQKKDGTYRIDQDFRIQQLIHTIAPAPHGFRTTLNLTSDLKNTFAYGPPTRASIMAEYVGALAHKEARDLKGVDIDILVPRLSKDYPS